MPFVVASELLPQPAPASAHSQHYCHFHCQRQLFLLSSRRPHCFWSRFSVEVIPVSPCPLARHKRRHILRLRAPSVCVDLLEASGSSAMPAPFGPFTLDLHCQPFFLGSHLQGVDDRDTRTWNTKHLSTSCSTRNNCVASPARVLATSAFFVGALLH